MITWRDGEPVELDPRRSAVTIGVFDGVHRGHQALVDRMVELARARDERPVVVTFDPHPLSVLHPERAPRMVATLDQRLEALASRGVEVTRVLNFDEFLATERADSFIERVLVHDLRVGDVVVGEDFRFGHDRRGDVGVLREAGREHDFVVEAHRLVGDGRRFSSTAVRHEVARGDVERAATVLGRPFTLRGVVVPGDERGRELGFPTANLDVHPYQLLPAEGVYAALVALPGGPHWPAAVSVGRRPQFYDAGGLLVEAHLIDFSGDLYRQRLDVAFLARLRGQAAFATVTDLVAQMGADVEAARVHAAAYRDGASSLLG